MKTLCFFQGHLSPARQKKQFSLCSSYVVCAELKLHLDSEGSVWVELLAWDVLGQQQWTLSTDCSGSRWVPFLINFWVILRHLIAHTYAFTTTTTTERSGINSHPNHCLMGRCEMLKKWSKTVNKQTMEMKYRINKEHIKNLRILIP